MFRHRRQRAEADPAPPGDPARYWLALDRLAALLDGLPWLVAGGLAIPLTLGRFYRWHKDIDIVLPFDRIGDMDDAMRRGGYHLTTRLRFHLGRRRLETLLPIRGRGLVIRLRQRKLRFVPRRPRGGRLVPARIDAMPYVEREGCIQACNSRLRVPFTEPLEGHRVTLPGGRQVGCLHLHYARALMRRPDTPVHRLDRAMIDAAFGYGSLVTAGPPRSSLETSHIA